MEDWLNLIRREVQRGLSLISRDRIGIVDSYDPATHAVKVRLQPQNTLSGWLPVGTLAAGNGFGVHFAPNVGDQVVVHPLDGVHEARIVGSRLFSTTDQPLSVPAGEMWVIHKTGSGVKFHNDGKVELISNSDMTITVGGKLSQTVQGDMSLNVSGNLATQASAWTHTGDLTISGNATISENITVDGEVITS